MQRSFPRTHSKFSHFCTTDITKTSCLGASRYISVRCSSVAYPVIDFPENVSTAPKNATAANKWTIFYPGHKKALSLVIFGKKVIPI